MGVLARVIVPGSFAKPCGPCGGRGYYPLDPKDTCKVCLGRCLIEFPGAESDYRKCSPCSGRGYYLLDPHDTCQVCRGLGLVPQGTVHRAEPFVPAQTADATHQFHREIERVSGKLFRDGHYRNAALDAYIRVIDEVKRRSGRVDLDGDVLMNHAFGCDSRTPGLRFNGLATESDKNEQKGMMFLFKGIVGLRNSKAHSNDIFDDRMRAYEYLALASLLMRLLELASKTDSASP